MRFLEQLEIRLDSLSPTGRSAISVLSLAALLVLSGMVCYRYLDVEAPAYIVDNLRPIPLLQNVFDIKANDYGIFRAREASYLFNILDSWFIKVSAAAGLINFLSLTHFLSLAVVLGIFFGFSKRFPLLHWFHRLLLALIFASSPVIILSSFYFRTSKILAGVFAFALCCMFLSHRAIAPKQGTQSTWTWWEALAVFVLGFTLTITDEQGVLYAVCLEFVLVVLALFYRSERWMRPAATLFLALVAYVLYRTAIGPYLTEYFSGAELETKLQEVYAFGKKDVVGKFGSVEEKGTDFAYLAWQFKYGVKLARHWFDFYFGSFWPVSLLAMAGFIRAAYPANRKEDPSWRKWVPLALLIGITIQLVLADTLMIGRHPGLSHRFVHLVYYGLPFTMCILALSPVVLNTLLERRHVSKTWATLGMLLILTLNLIYLPHHLHVREIGTEKYSKIDHYLIGDRMRGCIQSKQVKVTELLSEPSEIRLCQTLR